MITALFVVCFVASVFAQDARVGGSSCPTGYTRSSNCVVVESTDPASWQGKLRAWCKLDDDAFHPVASLDFARTTTNEAVRIIATLKEMPTEDAFEIPSRWGIFVVRAVSQQLLASQLSSGLGPARQVCVATQASFDSMVDSKRANLIEAEKSIQDNAFTAQKDISSSFICVVDKSRAACDNKAIGRDGQEFPGGPLPAEFQKGKYIRCSLNSFLIEAFNNGRLELVLRKMSFGRGPATGPKMHRTFISGELNIQRKTVEPRVHKITSREKLHKSSKYNGAAMPFSLFTNSDGGNIAFHQGSTSVASHGCVHLEMADAQKLFNWAGPTDPIQVQFLGPYPEIPAQCAKGFNVETSKCK